MEEHYTEVTSHKTIEEYVFWTLKNEIVLTSTSIAMDTPLSLLLKNKTEKGYVSAVKVPHLNQDSLKLINGPNKHFFAKHFMGKAF